jgi:hypothetical protein
VLKRGADPLKKNPFSCLGEGDEVVLILNYVILLNSTYLNKFSDLYN